MLFNKSPYDPDDIYDLITILKNYKYCRPLDTSISISAEDLLGKLLIRNEKKRISWNNFFKHKWFSTNNFNKDKISIDYKKENQILSDDSELLFEMEIDSSFSKKRKFSIDKNIIIDDNYIKKEHINDNYIKKENIINIIKDENFIIINSPPETILNIPNNSPNRINKTINILKNSINYIFYKKE